jgi:hypothetical protein
MSNEPLTTSEPRPLPRPVPAWVYLLSLLGIGVGAVAFGVGASSPHPAPAWRALLINFLFWTSVAQGAFMWAVTFRLSRTTWSAPVNRLGHSAVGFLGVSVLLFIALFSGRRFFLPWLHLDLGDRAVWLNVPFVVLRDGIALAVLFLLAVGFVRAWLRSDLAPAGEGQQVDDAALRRADRRLSGLGVSLALVYTIVATLIAFDLVMSLAPGWFSALFGWYYLVGGLYAGMAALIIALVPLRRWLGVTIQTQQFQDMGNLLMAFAMAMTYFFFSQALVIWYENLPPETIFAIPRVHLQPWRSLSWVSIGVCYLGPFLLLVVREMKDNPRTLFGVALLVFFAMWFERYLLITPSLAPGAGQLPVLEFLIGLGFLGLVVVTAAPLLARLPMFGPLDAQVIGERGTWR